MLRCFGRAILLLVQGKSGSFAQGGAATAGYVMGLAALAPILGRWIVERCQGRARGAETPLGIMPRFEDLDWTGLEKLSAAQYAELTRIDTPDWKDELHSHDELFGKLGSHLPPPLEARRGRMHERLAA